MSILGDTLPAFAERDTFLLAALGLASLGRRAGELIDQADGHGAPPADALDEQVLHALLGLVACRERWGELLDALPPAAGPPRARTGLPPEPLR